jgi:hypothetical protein
MIRVRVKCHHPILIPMLRMIGITLWCVRRENHDGKCSVREKDIGQ